MPNKKIIKTQKVCNMCNTLKPINEYRVGRGTCTLCYNNQYKQIYREKKKKKNEIFEIQDLLKYF